MPAPVPARSAPATRPAGAAAARCCALRELRADDDRGATAVEYGLLVGLIAVVLITAVTIMGDNLNDIFDGFKI